MPGPRRSARHTAPPTDESSDELARESARESAHESADESDGEPASEPAAQPDFGLINQSLQTFTAQMSLLSNLPAINDRRAQTRHKELVRLIKNVDNRLNRLEGRMAVK